MLINQSIVSDIKAIIARSKDNAIRAIDHQRTLMYWHIGKRIFEEEQEGKNRADYGTYLIKYLSEQLQPEFGSGFSIRQLNWYRQFYRTFPNVSTLWTHLSWSQYKLLLSIDSQEQREFYIAETVKNNWTVRQLGRQINSNLYELDEKSNVHFLHIANSDKPVKFYSLDVIISVGYRVKSIRGTQFRQFANKVLKEYMLKGYAVSQTHR
jgi:hypothetical protein